MNTTRIIKISNTLKELGISPNILGYGYLRYAIELALENPNILNSMVKGLYVDIAKRFGSTPSRVERAIRHAIERAWSRANVDKLDALFGYTVSAARGKPTNGEFIATVADYLHLWEVSNNESETT